MISELVFFFSSRRRHTRSKRDWSSDVCSSDLLTNSIAAYRDIGGDQIVPLSLKEKRNESTRSVFLVAERAHLMEGFNERSCINRSSQERELRGGSVVDRKRRKRESTGRPGVDAAEFRGRQREPRNCKAAGGKRRGHF